MTEKLQNALREHFDDDEADAIGQILVAGSRYAEGDALAGAKLDSMSTGEYERLNALFDDAGFDVEFNSRMSFVGFTKEPETHDEELNEAIRDL